MYHRRKLLRNTLYRTASEAFSVCTRQYSHSIARGNGNQQLTTESRECASPSHIQPPAPQTLTKNPPISQPLNSNPNPFRPKHAKLENGNRNGTQYRLQSILVSVVGSKSRITFDCYGDLHAIDNTSTPRFLIAILNATPRQFRGF
jgi:hypothetical protein